MSWGGHGHEAHDDHGHTPAASSWWGGSWGLISWIANSFSGMFDAIINGPFK